MSAELSERELSAIPVFPLPNVVLFPGTKLALHIFEPRYRDMMADCLREGRMAMAIAQLELGWQAQYQGRPPLCEVAGAGRITAHVRRPDGRYDLELEGLSRVRLSELPPEHAYRRARAVVLEEQMPEAGLPALELSSLLSIASGIVALARKSAQMPEVELLASADDAPARMLDRIAHQFVSDPAVRQALLETLDVAARLRQLTRYLAELRVAVADATERGPRTLH
jgi:Lon protease-like protein